MELYRDYLRMKVRARSWPVQLVLVTLPVDEIIPTQFEGAGDIVAACVTLTPVPPKQVQFATPCLHYVNEVVVSAPSVEGIETLDDLVP